MPKHNGGSFQVFAEQELRQYLERQLGKLRSHVQGESADYISNVNVDDYVNHLTESHMVEPLNIDVDGKWVNSYEADIPAEAFPGIRYDFRRGGTHKRQVVRYHIPISGNMDLLHCAPSTRLVWTHDVFVEGGALCFDVVDFSGDAEEIKREAGRVIGNLQTQAEHVRQEVEQFNSGLRACVVQLVTGRRGQLDKQNQTLASLGVPIRKAARVPETFVVPTVRKKVLPRPAAAAKAAQPVPALDPAVYEEILKTIHEMGKVFERYPSTYAGKNEEALRDHLILQLEPRFEGSTTGETFNRTGKTDILIRHEERNIFVAECKFWNGGAQHLKTLDQILSYLTWRDSKTAIIYFVKRKEMTPVLDEIRARTREHPSFVRPLGERDTSWHLYDFHLPGDPGCKIQLAVLAFHVPA